MKRFLKIVRNVLLILLIVGVSGYFAIQHPAVQTWLTNRATAWLSSELNTTVSVGSVDIDLWARIVLNDVYVQDLHGDSLMFIASMHIGAHQLDRENKVLEINSLQLDDPVIHMSRHVEDPGMNYRFILEYFAGGSRDTTDTSSYTVLINEMKINHGRVTYDNYGRNPRDRPGLDWNRLNVRNVDLLVNNFKSESDTVSAAIEYLRASDISGLSLHQLSGNLKAYDGAIELTDALVQTDKSSLKGKIAFQFDSIDDFNEFEDKVKMDHTFVESKLNLGDLAYFVSDFRGLERTVEIDGQVKGKISKLKGRNLFVKWDDHSWFKGNVDMDGLPDINQTFIELDIDEFTSNRREINRIPLPPFDSIPAQFIVAPDNFESLGQMEFKGNFTGFVNDFVAYGRLKTAIGNIKSDISLREDSTTQNYFYTGNLIAENFDLGKFSGEPLLGPLSCDVSVDGSGLTLEKVSTTVSGTIEEFWVNNYPYHSITLEGTFRKSFFDGQLLIRDPNAFVNFDGQVDFTTKDPLFNFDADIVNLDLKKLNIYDKGNYSGLSGQVKMNSRGMNLEKFNGQIDISDLTYCAPERDYYLRFAEIKSEFDGTRRTITLSSPIASGTVAGQFDITEIGHSFAQVLSSVLPSYEAPPRPHKPQNFDLDMTLFDFSEISELFIPDLRIAPSTRLKLKMDEVNADFVMNLVSDSISYQENRIDYLTLDARRPDQFMYFTLGGGNVQLSGIDFESFNLDGRSERDTIYTSAVWGTQETTHSGDVQGTIVVKNLHSFDFFFASSKFRIDQQNWIIAGTPVIGVDSTSWSVQDFAVQSGHQRLDISGKISENPEDQLNVVISAFELSNLNFITDKSKVHLAGQVTGTSGIRDLYEKKIFTSNLVVFDFDLNDYPIGDICVESTWDNNRRWLLLNGELEQNSTTLFSFNGVYRPDQVDSPIDVLVHANHLDIGFLNGFLDEGSLALQGKASGDINITGTIDAPQLTGSVNPEDLGIYIPYLNVRYFIDGPLGIRPDMFTMNNILMHDQEGNKGHVTATLMHENFGEWNFDVNIDTDVKKMGADGRMTEVGLLALNTTEKDNPLYYGKAYAIGYINIFGYAESLEFDINLKSAKNSSIALPLGGSEEVVIEDFIHFVDKDKPTEEKEQLDLTGIKLNFQLDITPDVDFKIIFDEAVGDVMEGHGTGHLNLAINQFGDFEMYGVVTVQDGSYLFTLKNLLNKEFTIRPGGTLAWYGDPFNAEIRLETVYKLSAALYDIMPEENSQYNQRVPVDLVMDLSGKLMRPDINFDIQLPTVDEVTRSRVTSAISTEEERNRQAFALLVLRRFVPPPNVTKQHSTTASGLAENGSELLSSQLSNWLNQISNDFNLGFNYRPGDEITNDEIAVALGTQLFNDKMQISGNFGVSKGNSANQNPSNLIGDIRIEYKLTPDGKLQLVVYNESDKFDIATTQQSPYTQGVGIVYREEFDTMDQFYCGFKNLFRRKRNQVQCF